MTEKSIKGLGIRSGSKVKFVKEIERRVTVNGRAIRAQRDFIGMSRRGVGNLCGWSIGQQQNIEELDMTIKMSTFVTLCGVLRIDVDAALADAPEKETPDFDAPLAAQPPKKG